MQGHLGFEKDADLRLDPPHRRRRVRVGKVGVPTFVVSLLRGRRRLDADALLRQGFSPGDESQRLNNGGHAGAVIEPTGADSQLDAERAVSA